jgi:putative transposase
MPRRARLSIPGIPWHIIQRGNNRAVCFNAEEDYQYYLHFLQEFSVKFGCAIHAYVLMTNHVHLLLTPQRPDSASLLMKNGVRRTGGQKNGVMKNGVRSSKVALPRLHFA